MQSVTVCLTCPSRLQHVSTNLSQGMYRRNRNRFALSLMFQHHKFLFQYQQLKVARCSSSIHNPDTTYVSAQLTTS